MAVATDEELPEMTLPQLDPNLPGQIATSIFRWITSMCRSRSATVRASLLGKYW